MTSRPKLQSLILGALLAVAGGSQAASLNYTNGSASFSYTDPSCTNSFALNGSTLSCSGSAALLSCNSSLGASPGSVVPSGTLVTLSVNGCSGGTPPYSYQWTNATAAANPSQATTTVTGPVSVSAVVTDSSSPTPQTFNPNAASLSVGIPALTCNANLGVSPGSSVQSGTVVTLSVSGCTGGTPPYTYQWTNATAVQANPTQATTTVTGSVSVSVVVTDSTTPTAKTFSPNAASLSLQVGGVCSGFSVTYDDPSSGPFQITSVGLGSSASPVFQNPFRGGEIINFAFTTGAAEPNVVYGVSAYEFPSPTVYRREIISSQRCTASTSDSSVLGSQTQAEPVVYFTVGWPSAYGPNLSPNTTYYATFQNINARNVLSCGTTANCPMKISVTRAIAQ